MRTIRHWVRYWRYCRIEKSWVGRRLQQHAWNEGWDEGRRVTVRACPDDFNPYRD